MPYRVEYIKGMPDFYFFTLFISFKCVTTQTQTLICLFRARTQFGNFNLKLNPEALILKMTEYLLYIHTNIDRHRHTHHIFIECDNPLKGIRSLEHFLLNSWDHKCTHAPFIQLVKCYGWVSRLTPRNPPHIYPLLEHPALKVIKHY